MWKFFTFKKSYSVKCPLDFIREFEDEDFRMNLKIEETEIIELRPDSPKGVYWHGGRAFYE